jgi:GTP-binding protein
MKSIDFKKVVFSKCIGLLEQLEGYKLSPAIFKQGCIVGRSNVGKSSLINHFLCNNSLAKTSSTPGKTQTLNFFTIDDHLLLVDLPGYGFAKKSKSSQVEWSDLIGAYFEKMPPNFVLLLIDIRIPLSQSDIEMCNWVATKAIPTIIVCTKADKIAPTKLASAEKTLQTSILNETILSPFSMLCYSVKHPGCRQKLISTILKLL